jgi:hypothetical protein
MDECLTPHIKTVCSSRAIALNRIQWFILVTFKDHTPKDVVHELGDTRHTLDLYCGRYIRFTSDDFHILLSKSQWAYIMDLAGSCVNRQILELFRLHDELLEWRNKCIESKSFCTSPETNAIDFETLYDEIMFKTYH